MASNLRQPAADSSRKAQHLCVLIHGLWGNSQHLKYINQSLREKHGEDELIILACKRNASSFTYDGIEIGGERVAREIEETIEELGKDGINITRLSVVGYSLGGLIARYAIGLLDHKGYFDRIQPANFTTFASPHLGVRTPLRGYLSQLFNVLGSRTLSASGRQLFATDDFRQTGRPLLSVLADPDSIFIHALSKFERRTLYANIVNDRSAPYYTTGISRTDPFTAMDRLKLNYIDGYDEVILDPHHPYEVIHDQKQPLSAYERITTSGSNTLRRAPIYLALTVLLPVGVAAFLVNSSIQTFRSRRRILLHETGGDGAGFSVYRIPYMMRGVRAGLEEAFEIANAAQGQDYLPAGTEGAALTSHDGLSDTTSSTSEKFDDKTSSIAHADSRPTSRTDRRKRRGSIPTLALTTNQFNMIQSLDDVGFRKFPVHIHNSGHSHAAIIVRSSRAAFDEGKIVVRHWLENEFRI